MSGDSPSAGDAAPSFEAVDETGDTVRLADFRGRPVILYFYPKDDTPGCTQQACGFRDVHEEFEGRDAVVLGVSPDGRDSHVRFKEKHSLPFTLLVDEDHSLAEAYGVWGEKKMYGRTFMGITRSHFVIDPEGVIVDVRRRVKPSDSPRLALEALEAVAE